MLNKNSLTDDDLIHLLKKDDKAAFSEIYSRYAEPLAGFASSRLYNIEDARDILHDLFVNLWEKRNSLVISGNLRSFLFAAIRYKIVDFVRKNITREEYKNMVQSFTEPHADSTEMQREAKELKALIENSLEKLPAKTKEIYKLSRDEYYSISEIAKVMGLSEQTVKNQLTIALKHLRQTIDGILMITVLIDLLKK